MKWHRKIRKDYQNIVCRTFGLWGMQGGGIFLYALELNVTPFIEYYSFCLKIKMYFLQFYIPERYATNHYGPGNELVFKLRISRIHKFEHFSLSTSISFRINFKVDTYDYFSKKLHNFVYNLGNV